MDEGDATEVELESDGAAAPSPARPRPWQRPLVRRLAVGTVVLLLSGAVSVAMLDTPSADRVDTEEASEDDSSRRSDRRSESSTSSSPELREGRGDRIRSEKSSLRGGKRETKSRSRSGSRGDKGWGGGSGRPRTPTTTTPTTTPTTPTTAPGTLALSPAGPLAPLAPLSVVPSRPCPAGTTKVTVQVTAEGGPADGVALVARSLTPAADGSWAVDALVVPAVAGVDDVAWASIAPGVSVTATCAAGPAYQPASIALAAVPEPPAFEATWAGDTVEGTVTGCPGQARLEVFVGATAPTLDGKTAPSGSVDMELDDEGTWTGSLTAEPAPGQRVWASASCLDRTEGSPVWRHVLVERAAP